jgi:hypothetical protein
VRRLNLVEAEASLLLAIEALAAHIDACPRCAQARTRSIFVWTACTVGADMERARLAMSHRVHYLTGKKRRPARDIGPRPVA